MYWLKHYWWAIVAAVLAACGAAIALLYRSVERLKSAARVGNAENEITHAIEADGEAQKQLDALKKAQQDARDAEGILADGEKAADAKDKGEGDADVSGDLARRGLR